MTHKIKSSNSSSGTKKCSSCRFVIDLGLKSDSLMHEMFRFMAVSTFHSSVNFLFPKLHENSVARRKSASLENANRLRVVAYKQRIEWWHLISQWRNPHHSTLNGKTNLSWMKFFGTTNDSWCFMNIYRSEGNYHIFPHFTMKQLFRRHLLIFRRLNDKNFAKTLLWSEKRHVE